MKFSVVIPCHNNREHIGAALRSVEAQSLQAAQVIVVDDGSSDDSAAVVRDVCQHATIISVRVGNAAAARNAGIEQSTGDWVAFLDADNVWLPDHLATAAALCSGTGNLFHFAPSLPPHAPLPTEPGIHRRDTFPIKHATGGLTRDDFVRCYLHHGWGFATSGMIVTRKRLSEIGGFDVTQPRRHDFEMMMRAIDGYTWSATPTATWWSRPPREGNISANKPICAYYALRALTLNRVSYDSTAYRQLMGRAALYAVKSAVFSEDSDLIRRAMDLAWPYLTIKGRTKLRLFTWAPPRLRRYFMRDSTGVSAHQAVDSDG